MHSSKTARRAIVTLAASIVAVFAVLAAWPPNSDAQTPPPGQSSTVVMTAAPMLGPSFRADSWVAVRVTLENSGPAVDGVLRLSSGINESRFALPVQLPPGARQEHFLYGLGNPLNSRFEVSLESDDAVLATQRVSMNSDPVDKVRIYVVAERPEVLVGPLRSAASAGSGDEPEIVAIGPDDLPPQVEPWNSIDMLVWHDVDTNALTAEQLAALRTWIGLGGDAVFVVGSAGASRLGAVPQDLIPYQPAATLDVQPADLASALGQIPAEALPVPAAAGPLLRGRIISGTAEAASAAQARYGQGSVALIGFDPTTDWITSSGGALNLWAQLAPLNPNPATEALGNIQSDAYIVNALSSIPAVTLPRMEQLFLLLAAYILTIGPITYLILKRRDRREWAWLTMPVTIGAFAVIAYVFGVGLRGSSVVVNELAIVRGAAGTDRGTADVHIGVYSPNRANFDVRVGGRPLLSSSSIADANFGPETAQSEPIDVELGDPAVVRGYQVGFGSIRSFKAQALVETPLIETDLQREGDLLTGTVRNAAGQPALDVAVVYGMAVLPLGELTAGEEAQVNLDTSTGDGELLLERLVPSIGEGDQEALRKATARRSIIRHLEGGWDERFGLPASQMFGSGPVVLAWRSGPLLNVELGSAAQSVGETLYVISAPAAIHGQTSFSTGLLRRTTVAIDAAEGFDQGSSYFLSMGTVTTEYRPAGLEGSFTVSGVTFRIGEPGTRSPTTQGEPLLPLPVGEQPPTDDPMLSNPRPNDGEPGVPRLQFFDLEAGSWIEFEPAQRSTVYSLPDPTRYVDQTGSLLVRFVVRDPSDYAEFTFQPRLEGTVE